MKNTDRIYGFRVFQHPDGWRRADCRRWIRFLFNLAARGAFRILPMNWCIAGGWRERVADAVLPFFGYWAYSHRE